MGVIFYLRKEYSEFLATILFNRVIDPVGLNLYFSDKKTLKKYIDAALELGHIHKTERTMRWQTEKSNIRRVVTLYSVTKSGILHICTYLNSECLNNLSPEIIDCLCMHSRSEIMSVEYKSRLAKITGAVLLTAKAGGYIAAENYYAAPRKRDGKKDRLPDSLAELRDEEASEAEFPSSPPPEPRIFLYELFGKYLTAGDYEGIRINRQQPDADRRMAFYSKRAVMEKLASASPEASPNDFSRTRMLGVIDSPAKSLAVYTPAPAGMAWDSRFVPAELSLMTNWDLYFSPNSHSGTDRHAALLVRNAHEFERIYRDADGKRSGKEGDMGLGDGYGSMYLIPLGPDGAPQLRFVSMRDEERTYAQLKKTLEETGRYRTVSQGSTGYCMENTGSGAETAIGYFFDICAVRALTAHAEMFPGLGFEIICFRWQEDYYRRIVPENVKIVPADIRFGK